MRLIVVSHSAQMAGAERSLLSIVDALARAGHVGVVLLPAWGPLAERLLKVSGNFHVEIAANPPWMGRRQHGLVGLARLVQCAVAIPALYAIFRRRKPDAVLVNTAVTPAPVIVARLLGLPVMVVVRESILSNPTLLSVLPRRWVRDFHLRFATQIVSVSEYVRQQMAGRGIVVYPHVPSVSVATTRPPLGNHPLRVLMIGTISDEKGQLDFVEALRLLEMSGKGRVIATIAGSGLPISVSGLRDEIRRAGLTDTVSYIGQVENPMVLYLAADISVVCARNEAFGRVTAESIAAGVPVLGYALGGTAEILAFGGGVLIPDDPSFLSRALRDLAEHPAAVASLRASCAGQEVVLECARSDEKFEPLLREMIRGRGR